MIWHALGHILTEFHAVFKIVCEFVGGFWIGSKLADWALFRIGRRAWIKEWERDWPENREKAVRETLTAIEEQFGELDPDTRAFMEIALYDKLEEYNAERKKQGYR